MTDTMLSLNNAVVELGKARALAMVLDHQCFTEGCTHAEENGDLRFSAIHEALTAQLETLADTLEGMFVQIRQERQEREEKPIAAKVARRRKVRR